MTKLFTLVLCLALLALFQQPADAAMPTITRKIEQLKNFAGEKSNLLANKVKDIVGRQSPCPKFDEFRDTYLVGFDSYNVANEYVQNPQVLDDQKKEWRVLMERAKPAFTAWDFVVKASQEKLAPEMPAFLYQVFLFKNKCRANQPALADILLTNIVNNFVRAGAPQEINIHPELRAPIIKAVPAAPPVAPAYLTANGALCDILDETFKHVSNDMAQGVFKDKILPALKESKNLVGDLTKYAHCV